MVAARAARGRGRPVSARAEILAAVRSALADVPAAEPPTVAADLAYRRSLGLDRPAILDLFVERVSDYRATVRRVRADGIPAAIAQTLAQRDIRRIAAPVGLEPGWLPGTVEVHGDETRLGADELDRLDGAVTSAAVGIALTGTIVLDTGPGQGRRLLSLVPDYHLCVVRAEVVVGTVPEGLARLDPTLPLTLISGPSATSDIELDRVEGVHGPRTLDVLLVETGD